MATDVAARGLDIKGVAWHPALNEVACVEEALSPDCFRGLSSILTQRTTPRSSKKKESQLDCTVMHCSLLLLTSCVHDWKVQSLNIHLQCGQDYVHRIGRTGRAGAPKA